MPEISALAKRVRAYRKSMNKTQFETACEIGISLDELGHIERQIANPTLETIQSIAAYMGITVSELLKIEDEENADRSV